MLLKSPYIGNGKEWQNPECLIKSAFLSNEKWHFWQQNALEPSHMLTD